MYYYIANYNYILVLLWFQYGLKLIHDWFSSAKATKINSKHIKFHPSHIPSSHPSPLIVLRNMAHLPYKSQHTGNDWFTHPLTTGSLDAKKLLHTHEARSRGIDAMKHLRLTVLLEVNHWRDNFSHPKIGAVPKKNIINLHDLWKMPPFHQVLVMWSHRGHVMNIWCCSGANFFKNSAKSWNWFNKSIFSPMIFSPGTAVFLHFSEMTLFQEIFVQSLGHQTTTSVCLRHYPSENERGNGKSPFLTGNTSSIGCAFHFHVGFQGSNSLFVSSYWNLVGF